MATKGRPPKPATEKKLRGGRKDRQPKSAPPVEAGRPECPDHLPWLAKLAWESITAELGARGQLCLADARLLELYCDAYARWRRACEILADDGPVIETDLGGCKANPAAVVADRTARLMKDILAEFGMTPNGRLRSKPIDDHKDTLGDFLAGVTPSER